MPLANKVILIALVLTAGFFDLRSRRIPNWLSLAGVLSGIALNSFLFEWGGLKGALFGLGLAFLIYFPLYLLHAMGAGDVKLMAAIGAIVGPWPWVVIFFASSIIGGVIGVILIISKGRFRTTLWNIFFLLDQITHFRLPYLKREELDIRSEKALRLPHGVSIALGTIATLIFIQVRGQL